MDQVLIMTNDGARWTTKEDILKGLESFEGREPDKTISLWNYMAEWLYKSQELKTTKEKP